MSLPLAAWMFPVLMFLIFMGFPVGFALMGTAFVFGIMIYPPDALAYLLTTKVADAAGSQVLAAVPLFIFMGTMMERSGIAERLFEVIHMWTRRLPGGLAVGTVLMCVVFAAASGVIGATESVVGLLAIPVMLKYAYDKGLISGTICAGGSLGTIIPPSIVVVILGPVADVDVGSLFVGMLFPGLILAGLYMLYILVLCTIKPRYGPRLAPEDDELSLLQKIVISVQALLPPVFLIAAVLGTIIAGWATPTEAAAMGAAGSIVLTLVYRTFTFAVLSQAFIKTIVITANDLDDPLGRDHVRRYLCVRWRHDNDTGRAAGYWFDCLADLAADPVPSLPGWLRPGAGLDHPDLYPDRDAADKAVRLQRDLVLHPVPDRDPD